MRTVWLTVGVFAGYTVAAVVGLRRLNRAWEIW